MIEAILVGSSSAPGSAEADALREAIAEWIGTLGDGSVTFPDKGVHAAVLTQLQHVLWLVDHQTLFSAATVATATQTCVGALVASAPTLPSAQQTKWKSAFTKLVLVLAAFNLAVDTSAAAIENAGNLADLAIEAGSAVHDAVIDDD